MELPVLVDKEIARKGTWVLLGCVLNQYSSRYKKEQESTIKPLLNDWGNFAVKLANVEMGEELEGTAILVNGDISDNSKYGKSFDGKIYCMDITNTYDSISTILKTLSNIKEQRASDIINKFGLENVLTVLNETPDRLVEINGLTQARVEVIKQEWRQKQFLVDLYKWVIKKGMDTKIAEKAFKRWGKDAKEKIEANPYILAYLPGISFSIADKWAHQLCESIDDNLRVTACINFCLDNALRQESNLYQPFNVLKKKVLEVIQKSDIDMGQKFEKQKYIECLKHVLKTNHNDFEVLKNLKKDKVSSVYLRHVWEKECYIVNQLYKRSQKGSVSNCSESELYDAERSISKFYGFDIVLDEMQGQAVKNTFNKKISVITGPGGTGKSMICKCIVDLAEKRGMSFLMMSPTGKAAKVLSEKTGRSASTIHRALQITPGSYETNIELTHDIVIIDEASMIGLDTMYPIFQSLQNNDDVHLVLIGDMNQLPSISPGNFLSDIIDSEEVPVTRLNKIHRQGEKSFIPLVANSISNGKYCDIPKDASDMKWEDISRQFRDQIQKFIIDFSKRRDLNELQMISPRKEGSNGVREINAIAQDVISSINGTRNKFIERNFNKFFEKDRVIQIRNDYDRDVFNGDMGQVVGVGVMTKPNSDKKDQYVCVDYYGKETIYWGSEIDDIMPSWCITVHKFQGSQEKEILFVMSQEASRMMSKELVYTAFSRAEEQLMIFGHKKMLAECVNKSVVRDRYTNLKWILREIKGEKIFKSISENEVQK